MVEGEQTEKIERKQIGGQPAAEGLRDEALKLMKENQGVQQGSGDKTEDLTNKGVLPGLQLFDGNNGQTEKNSANKETKGEDKTGPNSQGAPKDVPPNKNIGNNDAPQNNEPNVGNAKQDPRADKDGPANNVARPREEGPGKSEGKAGPSTETAIMMIPRGNQAEGNTRRR